jgi:hypothetical protein
MTNEAQTATATSYPTRYEAAMMLVIIALLIIQLAATIRAANYEPDCAPDVMMEDSND